MAHSVATAGHESQEPEAGVSGRFLLPNGDPAAGATWTIDGFPANQELVLEHGLPEDWTDPTGVLDADGRLDSRFDPPQAFQFFVTVEMANHVKARWRWGPIGPREVKDLGTVTLRPAGTVTGRIVDSSGGPLIGKRWRVYANEVARSSGFGQRPAHEIASADEATATFTLSGLPAGGIKLKVYGRQIGWSKEHMVTVTAGQTVTKDILLDEAEAFANRIVLTVFQDVYHAAPHPSTDHMWLVAANGGRRNASHLPTTSQSYAFDNVGPGTFRVEIDDPRYLPWSEEGVMAGAVLRPRLRGSAAVSLDVRSASGAPIALYSVDVRFENVHFAPNRYRPVHGKTPLEKGLLDGLVPADYTITVRTQEGVGRARIDALAPGETRALSIGLHVPTATSGTVRYPGGQAAAGIPVRLVTPAEERDSPVSSIHAPTVSSTHPERARHEIAKTVTDEDGAFELAIELAGLYIVVAGADDLPRTETLPFDTSTRLAPMDLALTLDRGGVLEGRVLFPKGLDPVGHDIVFVHAGSALGFPHEIEWLVVPNRQVEVIHGGRFTLGPLTAGPGDLYLVESSGGWTSVHGLPAESLSLGPVQIVEGKTIAASFVYPLGLITLALTPSELSAAPVDAVVTGPHGAQVVATSSSTSSLSPVSLEPGTYDVWLGGNGWVAKHRGLTVVAGEARTVTIDPRLKTRRVQFMRDGAPLANMGIEIADAPNELVGRRFKTDATGHVELRLGAGSYAFHLESMEVELLLLSASANWPLPTGVDQIPFE